MDAASQISMNAQHFIASWRGVAVRTPRHEQKRSEADCLVQARRTSTPQVITICWHAPLYCYKNNQNAIVDVTMEYFPKLE